MPGPATPPRPGASSASNKPLPLAPHHGFNEAAANARPVIPLTILDAPTQRLWAAGIYVALLAWKLYDWGRLVDDNAESFWLWLKWIAFDMAFLFGLPELRIPWLEFTTPFTIFVFFSHALLDWMLMFNYGLPLQAWLLGFAKVFYDREIAISENSVKMSNILHNSSLIMGRQVINILPEGSAVLNPDHVPFCLGADQKTAPIPLYLNATVPAEVELIRTDFDTGQSETIKLSKSQLREIERQAKRQTQEGGPQTAVQFDFPAKKPGAYQLGKVLDQYKLEVQRISPSTFVVACPSARVRAPPSSGRCLGELSDLALEVLGTPPLKIVYSRTINGKDHSFHIQSLQPAGFSSPLVGAFGSTSLVGPDEEGGDVSWARSQLVSVNLNESMHQSGEWQYSVDEVQDAFGNVAKYAPPADDPEPRPRPKNLVQNFIVKERPRVKLDGCDIRHPLKVAKGDSKELPVSFETSGPTSDDTSHTLTWQFSPFDTLTEMGDHGDVVSVGEHSAKNAHDRPRISASGLYTLKSVTSGSCEGEVQEPSSCLLLNPLEPKVSIRAAEIPDTCAGNSVGLRVDLDLVGTPPFVVRYETNSNGRTKDEKINIPGMRHQLDLIPRLAGHYEYRFTHIGDAVYQDRKLSGSEFFLKQDVKPIAHVMISKPDVKPTACLGEEAQVKILLFGEPPFTLEWESILDGKRKSQRTADIGGFKHIIKTDPLTQGGEYTIALTGVTDRRGCRQFLKDEVKISVRRQSPRGGFGLIDHKRQVMGVEGSAVKLPLRLTGEGPWRISYANINESSSASSGEPAVLQKEMHNDNDFLPVSSRGIFQITDIWDNECHGLVDPKASTFEVDWYARPQLSMVANPGLSEVDGQWVVNDVCEGDVSGFEIDLKGSPPYHVEYEIRHQPLRGPSAISRRDFDAALGKASVQMDTSKAGTYTYTFTSLADYLYNNDPGFTPVPVRQKVNSKPAAAFVKPGQTFKYCTLEQREVDGIPITLTGVAPFSLEMEIKHQSGTIPEVFRTATINQHSFQLQIPRAHLKLGTSQVRIRSVRDASGCHSSTAEAGGGGSSSSLAAKPSVQVQLFDAPSIYALETRTDYCVGERLAYTLAGTPPFEVWYTFDGQDKKAKSATTSFRRVAELPGDFTITTVADRASECRAPVALTKTIHPMPAVKISRGKNARADIHEGGEVDILFEFWGTPPFEFTYTRSTNARKGQRSHVLETRHDTSLEHTKVVRASQEGTYEVVAIKDYFCAFSTMPTDSGKDKGGGSGGAQKMLGY